MLTKVFNFALLFFFFIFTLGAEVFSTQELKERFEKNIRKYRLQNGLRIILMRNGISPSLALYLKIGVGSADEPLEAMGVAHFLEHLLFKGTTKIGTLDYRQEEPYLQQIFTEGERLDELSLQLLNPLLTQEQKSLLEKEKKKAEERLHMWEKLASRFVISEEDSQIYNLAGQVGYNAYTTTDVTNYQIKLPSNRLELWAAMESDRFLEPVFREFYAERRVILEERRLRYDTKPFGLLYELYLSTAFGLSAYGKPVIGYPQNIPYLTYSQTRRFFEEHYHPSQMVIAVVGNLDFEETYKILEKYFSRLPAGKPPSFVPISSLPQKGRRLAWLEQDSTPQFITGFKRPSVHHPDAIAFEVLARLLGEGQTSRLKKRLVLDEKIASQVIVYSSVPGDKLETTFAIFCSLYSEKHYELAEKAIWDELEKVANGTIDPRELEKIKNGYIVDLLETLQTNAGLADNLSYYELMFGDYRVFYRFLDELNKLHVDDLARVAREYFVMEKNTTVYVKPINRDSRGVR
ncbi:MAG: pitrilysin family protein [Leptospiraceae bacterium]|nr:pitrilysin family protein [Leptospiraceae bacterium]